ncbi:SDR family NAD(P)-dependent oxidoreductase [Streptomyces sp. URMC 126]|uniref:SDR family NAD(P)-dependent oxidoreductase n=1 Tax=Streptomyces sp. URMC 126 TaxID=3423401 RepID=UPI003F1CA1D6
MPSTREPSPVADRRLARDPVAIVGLAGMFPRARDLAEFWDNVVRGRDCTEDVPEQWWDPDVHHDPDPFAEDRTYCRRGGFLTPVTVDPLQCGLPPRTLDSTGLVQLLALRAAGDVLDDAALGRTGWYDPARTGVVLGVCGTNSTLLPLVSRLAAHEMRRTMVDCGVPEETADRVVRARLAGLPPWTEDSFPGVLGNVVSGRIANRFDLGAANHTVDAACASSLAAVRCAVDELLARRADMMLTGGCDADNSIVSYLCFTKTPALSPTGRVRPFDKAADGTLVGEGIGMLALKRLADARRDGDRVYAVLRGLGGSSDGAGRSIYAPCGEGQLTALRRAYEDAECAPGSVGLVEAHGTGTPTGDAVELEALDTLLRDGGPAGPTAVGSVKSQIGHTKAAAGAAGLIKAALALHHRVLPPTVNVTEPQDRLTDDAAPLYVNTEARPWTREAPRPVRRAGVSAFGFGGVNYHAVLEEAPEDGDPVRAGHRTPRARLWHAETAERLRHRLEEDEPPDEGPVPAGHARVGFVARDDAEHAELRTLAVEQLRVNASHERWDHGRGIHYRHRSLDPLPGIGVLFSGQGSQYVGMGRDAALTVPAVRAAFEAADGLFPAADGLVRTVFPPAGTKGGPEGDALRLRRTTHAQPAIGALSRGHFAYLRDLGLPVAAVLGHSFGELTALWAAGVLDDEAFTGLAHARGAALRPPAGRDAGTMAAVRAPEDIVRALLAGRPGLVICNRNAPDEYVVGGPTDTVTAFVRAAVSRGVPAQGLAVDAAFHTACVEYAAEPFAEACAKREFGVPAVPVHSCTPGAAYGEDPDANRDLLAGQLLRPVDFAARVEEMYADGVRVFVECGPRNTLTRLVERQLGERAVAAVPCDTGPGQDGYAALKRAALRLAVLGYPLAGLDRHDAPPPPARPAPSKAARRLEGPHFAVVARRPAYDAAVAEAAALADAERRERDRERERARAREIQAPPATPARMPVPEDDALAAAAARHLTAHTAYLDVQLHIARELTGLLRRRAEDGRVDPSLVEAVTAVTEHSLAVGDAHTRAGEVVARMLGAAGDGPGTDLDVRPATELRDDGTAWSVHEAEADEGTPAPDAGTPDAGTPNGSSGPAAARSALAAFLDAEAAGTAPEAPAAGGEIDPVEIERVLREVTADRTGYDVDMIEPDMLIQEDLGIDSLKRVEIGAEVWRRYPQIDRGTLYRLAEARTVGELADRFVEALQGPSLRERALGEIRSGTAVVTLRDLPDPDVRLDAYPEGRRALVLDDGTGLSAVLAGALRADGWDVAPLLLPGAEPAADVGDGSTVPRLADLSEPELAARLGELLADTGALRLCVLPVGRTAGQDAEEAIARLRHAVLVAKHSCPALAEAAGAGGRAALVTVTRLDGALGHAGSGGDGAAALAGGLGGLVKTVALEEPALFCRALDFAPDLADADVAAAFIAEIADLATDVHEVGRDAAGRRTPVVEEAAVPVDADEEDADGGRGLMLVTGGASGITAWCVTALAETGRFDFLLLGRTPLSGGPDRTADADEAGAPADGERDGAGTPEGRIRAVLAELRERGVAADYLAVDVRDGAAVTEALAPYASRVTAVLHGAGVLGDKPLSGMEPDSVAAVVDTKVAGLHHVLRALEPGRLRHLVLFTSVSGVWGNARQTDYALANEALNRFGRAFREAHPDCRVLPVAWGPWAGGMAARLRELYVEAGVPVLTREEGCGHFVRLLAAPALQRGATVVVGPLAPLYRRVDRLPEEGVTARCSRAGLAAEPVLRDHRIDRFPVLPMTAAIGWGVNSVERALGGMGAVVECRDFRIVRGLAFDGEGYSGTYRTRLVPEGEQGPRRWTKFTLLGDDGREEPHYEGSFLWSDRGPEPGGRIALPPFTVSDAPHPGYANGRLFHGPTLRGLRDEVPDATGLSTFVARMTEPPFGKGGFSGRLHAPALADLLMQGVCLVGVTDPDQQYWPMPVGVERLELFAPLPDGEPFVVRVDRKPAEPDAVFAFFDVTACAPDGRVLQRWTGVRTLWAEPRRVAGYLAANAHRAG